ncbi:MAG TPA: tetratricopeptide repeat protein [Gemmata sp.]|jgi:Flp pilus assembly protein TadD|nr:tetratricopeptide repeat protein [Gemmata sp.]
MTRNSWLSSLAILLLVGVSLFILYRFNSSTPPTIPPDPKAEELEPAVTVAVRTMRERVLKEPKSAKAWGELGEVFLANELAAEARVCLVEAARLEQTNPHWPYLQALILVNDGDREAALPFFQQAVDLSQNDKKVNLAAHLVLAETQLHLGLVKEAETHIRHGREHAPEDPRVQFDAGLLAIAVEDWEAARDHLLRCLTSPYTRKKARIQLAPVCRRLKDFLRADELQKESDQIPIDWDWPDPVIDDYLRWAVKKRNSFKMAENLEAQGRFDEAVQKVRSVVESYPDDDVAQTFLGRLLAQMGDFQGSERALQQAVQLAPHKVYPHYIQSLLLIRQGEAQGNKVQAEAKFQEAVNHSRQALAIKPDYGFAHMALGLALKHLGKTAEAAKELQEAVRCSPEYAEMHLRLAEVLVDLGRKDEACSRYEEALRLASPGTPWRASVQARLTELQKVVKKPAG